MRPAMGAGSVATVIIWFGIVFALAACDRYVAGSMSPGILANVVAPGLLVVSYGVPAAFLLWRLPILFRASLHDIGLRKPADRDWNVFITAAVWVALVDIVLLPFALFIQHVYFPNFVRIPAHTPAQATFTVTYALVIATLTLGVLVPFSAELLARGLVFRGMRTLAGFVIAALVASLFSSLPAILWLFPVYIGLDFLISWSYERTGNLFISMLVHSFNNFALIGGMIIAKKITTG